ncbi:MAG: radical SAM protein [Candidatus Omnitrophota bacterium]
MKLSKFNLLVKDYPVKGEYLLFNTRTQALITVTNKFKEFLDSLEASNVTVYGMAIKEKINALKENGIVVEDEKEDQDKLSDFFRQLKYESNVLPFEATILTTYNCNFKCVYCFEESVRDNIFLDIKTSEAIINWLKRRIQQRGYKRIYLVYYGGEPLLNVKPVYDISWHMQAWADKNGVEFGFGIITNGSLVNPELIDKLLTVGLKEIRVSLDGDRNAHNKKRPFSDGRPTFDLIVNNIKRVMGKVNVGISGNFDRKNYKSIYKLLDYLEEQGILRKLHRINFAPLTPRFGPKNNPGAVELKECFSFVGKEGLFKEVTAITKELMRRRLTLTTGLSVNICPLIMQDGGITIDPGGVIYKCNALVGYREFSIGNVADEGFNEKFSEFLNIDAWNKCPRDCPYIPMCQGGCRFFSYLENKNFCALSCKRDYFDKITPELIKLEYDKLTNDYQSSLQ